MDKLDKAIAIVKAEIECFDNPGAYHEEEYYVRCRAKVDVLEDVLHYLEELKKEPQVPDNSWKGEVDRQGGSFTQEEIANATEWR
ncbi:MAG TPA: hypothetical protein VFM18_17970 [Methanosarcina sp.]|nr:hypothetical protein [Methanosarcina sp.]